MGLLVCPKPQWLKGGPASNMTSIRLKLHFIDSNRVSDVFFIFLLLPATIAPDWTTRRRVGVIRRNVAVFEEDLQLSECEKRNLP